MLIFINLKTVGYHLMIDTTKLLTFFSNKKNHNQNYKQFIDFIPFLKSQKIISNVTILRKNQQFIYLIFILQQLHPFKPI
jgi:hypothetical protein